MNAIRSAIRPPGVLFAAILLVIETAGDGAAGQDWQWAVATNLTGQRVVGLLNLPEVVANGCGPLTPKSVDLFDAPSTSSRPSRSIALQVSDRQPDGSSCGSARVIVRRADGRVDEELPTDESDYEIPAAVVYEQSGSWFRIALQQDSAWIRRENRGDFLSYPELLTDRLVYIRNSWDGNLWPAPGTATAAPIPSQWTPYLDDDIPVEVVAIRRLRNEVWVQVRLQTETCGAQLTGVQSTTGWIPAYRSSGATSLWFHSRGC